jgi:hypothetical protein
MTIENSMTMTRSRVVANTALLPAEPLTPFAT